MLELSARLTQTLENYGIKGEVVAIRPGPVVTMYEFAPAAGTRVNKIANLSDDLAMALTALSVRIVAPIPGKAAVGIEVPNIRTARRSSSRRSSPTTASASPSRCCRWRSARTSRASPQVVDLAEDAAPAGRRHHRLGQVGGVNAMITSLLYKAARPTT
jgi:S-DNA-T family DNA segregation ATPase FtsK/SpoIIIE